MQSDVGAWYCHLHEAGYRQTAFTADGQGSPYFPATTSGPYPVPPPDPLPAVDAEEGSQGYFAAGAGAGAAEALPGAEEGAQGYFAQGAHAYFTAAAGGPYARGVRRILGLFDFVHPETGRKVQLVIVPNPRVRIPLGWLCAVRPQDAKPCPLRANEDGACGLIIPCLPASLPHSLRRPRPGCSTCRPPAPSSTARAWSRCSRRPLPGKLTTAVCRIWVAKSCEPHSSAPPAAGRGAHCSRPAAARCLGQVPLPPATSPAGCRPSG